MKGGLDTAWQMVLEAHVCDCAFRGVVVVCVSECEFERGKFFWLCKCNDCLLLLSSLRQSYSDGNVDG